MRGDEENAPGAGQQTGGEGEHVEDNPDIIGDSIAPDGTGADQKDLLPDPDAAVDFLEAWRPGGPWVLTAIEVDPPKAKNGKSKRPRIPTVTLTWPNMLHVIISSNSEWVVPAGPFERRYAVFDVAATQRQRRGYFAPLFAELESGGLAAMLHDLLAMDLGRWHPREDVPKTDALNDQKSRGLDPIHSEVLDMLHEGALPFDMAADTRGTDACPFVATNDFKEHVLRRTRVAVTSVAVSKVLKKIGAKKNRKSRPSGYVLPILGEARASWNAQPDLPAQNWDEAADWAGSVEPW